MTFEPHVRWAVISDHGLVCKNTGHDYKTGKPGYSFTKASNHARLFATKSAATKCAQAVGGRAILISLVSLEIAG